MLTKKQNILKHPIARIILGLMACFIAFILAQNILDKLLELAKIGRELQNLIKGIGSAFSVILAYRYFFGWIEKRKITELSSKNLEWNLVIGVSIGTFLQILTIMTINLFGDFYIISVNNFSFIIIPLAVAIAVATFEEILIRGIIFRIIEEKLGSYAALGISALIFAALHIFNPGASFLSTICVFIAGLLFGSAYIYARNLWLPIAIHFAWNFVQSGIFGSVTSGNDTISSLLTTKLSGNILITGGNFGPEATLQAIVFCGVAAGIFIYMNVKNRKLIHKKFNK